MGFEIQLVDGILRYEACVSGDRFLDVPGPCVHDGVGTMFVVTFESAVVEVENRRYVLPARSYAVLPNESQVHGGRGIAIIDRSHSGLFIVGGPVEETGRLRYINGCSDTLLVAPVVRGDPCLNLLHIPRGVVQTDHEHPSLRLGLVLGGSGRCVTDGEQGDPLVPGSAFVLPPRIVHRFETSEDELLLVAWHPDSDSGPSDDDHPMLNRTLLPGGRERVRREMP
jgi:quercetin dioxygenase-like cupin family protein